MAKAIHRPSCCRNLRARNRSCPPTLRQPLDLPPGPGPIFCPRDEVIKWQGQSRPPGLGELLTRLNNRLSIYPRMPRQGSSLSSLIADAVFQLVKLVLLAVLSVALLLFKGSFKPRASSAQPRNARYALTDKACYVAGMGDAGLVDVLRVEIRKNMALGLGGGSVSFAVGKTKEGPDEPIGFMDIPDADAVHAMILMLRETKE